MNAAMKLTHTEALEIGRCIHMALAAERTTVQRAYLMEPEGAVRVLVGSDGRIFDPRSKSWSVPAVPVVKVKGTYERWVDVPHAWLGFQPWFK